MPPGDDGAAGAAQLCRMLVRDAGRELARNWDPFVALDLSLAMLEARRAGISDADPVRWFRAGLEGLRGGDLRPWLYRGAAQIGWTAAALHRTLGVRVRNMEAIDELVLSWIASYPPDEDTELLFGIAGLGVYGLDHFSPVLARRITSGALRVIDERLERQAQGSCIRLRPVPDRPWTRLRAGWKAVGVAHGNAGIAAFLARVVSSGLGLENRARPMLADVARWLVSVASPDSVYVYDSYLDRPSEPAERTGRSSWCHGDPGISLALDSAADSLADDPVISRQVRACSRTAARAVIGRPAFLARVDDCCVCHGAAFLYYFGRRMADARQPGAAAFAARWYAYIRHQREQGPLRYQAQDGMRPDASFLGGDSGVVCALTRYVHGRPADWERLILTG